MCQTRAIPLTQGQVTIVDAADYKWLNQWKWCALKRPYTFYAIRTIRKPNGKRILILMHRLILGTPEGMDSDHRNGDGLDNRRTNLRICTHQQNCRNRKLVKNNTSGHKGVRWHVQNKKWEAQIAIDGKQVYLGIYDNIDDAIASRQAKEKEVFGEFARLTTPTCTVREAVGDPKAAAEVANMLGNKAFKQIAEAI